MKPGTFEWLHPITELVGVLVWPVLVGVVIIVFRRQVRDLLGNLSELTIGSNKAKFRKKGSQLSEELLAKLTTPSDSAASTGSAPDDIRNEAALASEPKSPPKPRSLLREYYADRIRDNPLNAILEGNLAIERWFDGAITAHGFSATGKDYRKRSSHEMSLIALDLGMISATSQNAVDGLAIMRDLAIDKGGDAATSDQAREFLILADGLLFSMDRERAEFEKRHPPTSPEETPLY